MDTGVEWPAVVIDPLEVPGIPDLVPEAPAEPVEQPELVPA